MGIKTGCSGYLLQNRRVCVLASSLPVGCGQPAVFRHCRHQSWSCLQIHTRSYQIPPFSPKSTSWYLISAYRPPAMIPPWNEKYCCSNQNFRATTGGRAIWAGDSDGRTVAAVIVIANPSFCRNEYWKFSYFSPSRISLRSSPIKEITKEKQGDFMEKWFCETQGKHSSSGTRRRRIARNGVELTLAVDKW